MTDNNCNGVVESIFAEPVIKECGAGFGVEATSGYGSGTYGVGYYGISS